MIIPRFEIGQSDDFVSLIIRLPYIKTSEVEWVVADDTDFRLYAKPYYLALTLPGAVHEDGDGCTSCYDVDSGLLTIKLPKVHRGQVFPNLHLLTELLSKKKSASNQPQKPLIQEMDDPVVCGDQIGQVDDQGEDEVNERQGDDQPQVEAMVDWNEVLGSACEMPSSLSTKATYGFNGQHSEYFLGYEEMASIMDALEIGNPEDLLLSHPLKIRHQMQREAEDLKFDVDYCVGDVINAYEECLGDIIKYQPWWMEIGIVDALKGLTLGESAQKPRWSEKEQDILVSLPRKSCKVESMRSHYLSLASILFAYCYDHRINLGDHGPESVWQITILSPTLSWFHHPTSITDLVESMLRRTLSYPLYRHVDLFKRCFEDMVIILESGRVSITKSLLDLISMFRGHEDAWRIARVWLEDFAAWVQQPSHVSDQLLQSLVGELKGVLEAVKSDGGYKDMPPIDQIPISTWTWMAIVSIATTAEQESSALSDASNTLYSDSSFSDRSNTLIGDDSSCSDTSSSDTSDNDTSDDDTDSGDTSNCDSSDASSSISDKPNLRIAGDSDKKVKRPFIEIME